MRRDPFQPRRLHGRLANALGRLERSMYVDCWAKCAGELRGLIVCRLEGSNWANYAGCRLFRDQALVLALIGLLDVRIPVGATAFTVLMTWRQL